MFMFFRLAALLSVMSFSMTSKVRARVSGPARGANFIEYALLAVIAIVVFAVFRDTLTTAFGGVMTRVQCALNSSAGGCA